MPQFFIRDEDFKGETAFIRGDDFHHLVNVRRVRKGERIRIRDASGKGYISMVSDITGSGIRLSVIEESGTVSEQVEVYIYMCLIKGGNFEYVIQKTVEVGVQRIIPVISERTVPDPGKKMDEKRERWNRIALGAAKQCLRSSIPQIGFPLDFSEAVKETFSDIKIIAHPEAGTGLREYLSRCRKPDSVSILVGPEGGFTEREIVSANEAGWVPVNCGTTHLRAETAAVILPSLVLYHWS
jgi:16S rRNA (uracil1498-N3)-methyltransferase